MRQERKAQDMVSGRLVCGEEDSAQVATQRVTKQGLKLGRNQESAEKNTGLTEFLLLALVK